MPTLFIAGDSTAAKKAENKRPESGWGEYLEYYISPHIKVKNYAENGRSTKSFIDLGCLDKIDREIHRDDYLLIQFGHNDEKMEDPSRYTTKAMYQDNLERIITVARKHQAKPILISSITRRKFKSGVLDKDAVGLYPYYMKEVSERLNVAFIDAYQITQDIISKLGETNSKKVYLHLKENEHVNYPNGLKDDTHLSSYGAKLFASLIALELNRII